MVRRGAPWDVAKVRVPALISCISLRLDMGRHTGLPWGVAKVTRQNHYHMVSTPLGMAN
jgi:hypothetical protein